MCNVRVFVMSFALFFLHSADVCITAKLECKVAHIKSAGKHVYVFVVCCCHRAFSRLIIELKYQKEIVNSAPYFAN